MDQAISNLYGSYLRAVQFFNARLEQRRISPDARGALRLSTLTADEFPTWWALVSEDKSLQSRWLDRFDDPEGSLTRACQRISQELRQLSKRSSAA